MRVLVAVAVCAALSGCVNDGLSLEALEAQMRTDIEHDAHCRSLLMVPGTLVYVQCRLALRQTAQTAYERRSQRMLSVGGALPPDVDIAIRDDAVCNLNKSAENSLEPGDAEQLAAVAYEECAESRERLRQAVLAWQPIDGERLLEDSRADAVAANEATILEARALNAPVAASAG